MHHTPPFQLLQLWQVASQEQGRFANVSKEHKQNWLHLQKKRDINLTGKSITPYTQEQVNWSICNHFTSYVHNKPYFNENCPHFKCCYLHSFHWCLQADISSQSSDASFEVFMHCVVWWMDTNVSKDHSASIFRAEVCGEWEVGIDIGRVWKEVGINGLYCEPIGSSGGKCPGQGPIETKMLGAHKGKASKFVEGEEGMPWKGV
jgi:hypothetical protein